MLLQIFVFIAFSGKYNFNIWVAGLYLINVYNLQGRKVAELGKQDYLPGTYKVRFDATKLVPGIYIYQLMGNNVSITKKMILMK